MFFFGFLWVGWSRMKGGDQRNLVFVDGVDYFLGCGDVWGVGNWNNIRWVDISIVYSRHIISWFYYYKSDGSVSVI